MKIEEGASDCGIKGMQMKIMVIMTIADVIDIDHIKDILKTLTPPSPRWQQHRSADVPASDSDD